MRVLTPNIQNRVSVDHGRALTAARGRISPDRAVVGAQNAKRLTVARLARIGDSR
jgi:hypothetical protein